MPKTRIYVCVHLRGAECLWLWGNGGRGGVSTMLHNAMARIEVRPSELVSGLHKVNLMFHRPLQTSNGPVSGRACRTLQTPRIEGSGCDAT